MTTGGSTAGARARILTYESEDPTMPALPSLQSNFETSAQRRPDHVAVEDAAGTITYRELNRLSDGVRDRLVHLGVRPGDRVGICFSKSIESIAAILGILKSGAAYVPVDPDAPAARNAFIFGNCAVRAIFVDQRRMTALSKELATAGSSCALIVTEDCGGGTHLASTLERENQLDPAPVTRTVHSQPDDLAYILYTSGSTGKPKGVMLSQGNAVSFVDWCSEVLEPSEGDRFSSHAPLHFDLSILDLYVPLKHGATVVIIGEELGKDPGRLAAYISEARISSWYSTPAVLTLLTQFGKLANYDYSALHTVLFAGEVFPVKHLRALMQLWPRPRYFNLYGPTETNVCTYFKIPDQIPEDRDQPYPIGQACSHVQARVLDESNEELPAGQEGELVICGAPVMQGYWNLPDQSNRAFIQGDDGRRWYRTGDIVIEGPSGDYDFVGRRDRMVKRRGYRIELGEIESALYRHSAVKEAAAVATTDGDGGVRITAFVCCGETRPSIIEMKKFCVDNLPKYMIPDVFAFREVLPKTSTDKIDYQMLKETA
jgi:amino acid adenylation domain-containing protein